MEDFGKFCFGVLIIVATFIVNGFVFMKFWHWFIMYTFAVQPINLIQSIGLMFVWNFMKPTPKYDKDAKMKDLTEHFFKKMAMTAVVFFIGWILTFFQ